MADPVAAWFAETASPMADVMRAVRHIIMEDPDVTETIKYRAPAFEYDGILCYFNWSAKKQASLIFPNGRSIPGYHPSLDNGSNLQRMMYFADLAQVEDRADHLRNVIASAIADRDSRAD